MITNVGTLKVNSDNRVLPVQHQHGNSCIEWPPAARHQLPHSAFAVDNAQAVKDRQLLDQVKAALHNCGFEQLRRLRSFCDHGRITLQGRVSTYYLKQVAQEVTRSVVDVQDIDNDLHVVCPH